MVTTLTEYDEISVALLSQSRIRRAPATATAARTSGVPAARTTESTAPSPDRARARSPTFPRRPAAVGPLPDIVDSPVALLAGAVGGQLDAEQDGPLVPGHEPAGGRPVPVDHSGHTGHPLDLLGGSGDTRAQRRVPGLTPVDQHQDLLAAAGELPQPLRGLHRLGVRAEAALVRQPSEDLGAEAEAGGQHHHPGGHHEPAPAVHVPGEGSEHAVTSWA